MSVSDKRLSIFKKLGNFPRTKNQTDLNSFLTDGAVKCMYRPQNHLFTASF